LNAPRPIQPKNLDEDSPLHVARIGGGVSARVGAGVVAAVLVGVVLIGVLGRGPGAPSGAAAPAAQSGGPSPAAAASLSANAPPTLQPRRQATPYREAYGIRLQVGKVSYLTTLDQLGVDHLSAVLRVPFPATEHEGALQFNQLWADQQLQTTKLINRWRVPLDSLSNPTRDATVVVDFDFPAHPKLLNVPPPIRRGYHLTVYASNDLLFGLLSIEVTLGPRPGIDGDDGIFGWPTTINLFSPDGGGQ
jgi:hypothetical protein